MNCGAWTYYFSDGQFPVGAGVLPIMIMLYLIVYPFHFTNGLIAVIGTSIPFVILLLSQGNMSLEQLPYLLFLPSIFLIANKRNREIDFRRDFYQSKILETNRKLMQKTLKRYFGENLTEKILTNEGDLKGDNIWVSISFTDISSYSTIIEHMSPETAVKFLNEYFSAMHDVIEKHNGQILNYIGDSVMVVFGAPEKLEDHELLSVRCAIGMREQLNKLNQKWDENEFSRYWKNHEIDVITARTGIHTGSVIAGNIGSDRMLQYSTIGDTVNVASRLEQRNKEFSTNILFSHEIYTSLTKDLYNNAQYQGKINLKGRDNKTKVYSI
jgi:adenylate cyclase